MSAARAPLGSPSSSSSWKFLPSPEKREEELNSSFCYPQDNRFIQTRSPESRKPGWPGCRPCEEAAARLLRVAARRSLCRFLVLLCSSSSSSSISPSASQAQLAKSTAGAIFRLCGRGSKIGTWRSENRTCCVAGAGREWKILVFGSKNQTQILKSRIFFL